MSTRDKLSTGIDKTKQLKGFKITYSYARGYDKGGIDSLVAGVQAIEDMVVSNTNIVSVVEANREALSVKYTEEFENFVGGYTDGAIRFFKSNSAELLHGFIDEDITDNPAPVTGVKHRPVSKNYPITNAVICTYANGCVKCWNYNYKKCLFTIKEKRQTFGVAYHPRLPKFVTCGDDSKIYLYDEENRVQERIFSGSNTPSKLDGHTSRVFAACFSPSSNHELITGGWDDVVFFWDVRQPFAVRNLSGIHICGDGLDISPKGTEIVTCAWQIENQLQVWDYGSGKLIQTIIPDDFSTKLYCGGYINKDFIFCGGTEPNLLRIIDLKTYTVVSSINKMPGAIYSVSIGPYKKVKQPELSSAGRKTKGPGTKQLAKQLVESFNVDSSYTLPKIAVSSGKRIYQLDFSAI